ncbi:oligosaccharide repeat unit polymerase [Pedobacter westerhofensis]|uniref:Oligosaccharide repeat unit polymerase n=1 Tax=Pedobacter westerhofensis TaxID=425512 RepID=A0A521C9D3_9SPHI|nr:O-antigen polymerase [Pedobacter westerhofensis]SMO55984.1 oligosaccharide repeat unit polymerase [Pedobacter westerhofensis]
MSTKNIVLISLVSLFIIADILLFSRYAAWDSTVAELLPFLGFALAAETVIVYAVYTYGQLINPFTIYAVFIYTAGFSFIRLSNKQQAYDWPFILILILSVLFFIAGGLVASRTFKFSFRNIFPPLNARLSFTFLLLVLFIGMGVFVMEISQLGYLPVLKLGNAAVYNDLNENEVTPLHNFIVLNSVLPAMFYINYKKGNISFLVFLMVAAVSGFIILNFFSRQIIILFFFSMLIAVNYYRKIPVGKLVLISSAIVVIFILLGQLRNSSDEDDKSTSINDFLREYNGISRPTNILETYLSLYGGVNFSTGQKITSQAVDDGYHGYGAYMMRPLITVLPVNKNAIYPLTYSSYTQLGTYVTDPFLDFRWAGVILLNFLYGYLSMNSFKNYLAKKSEYYIVEWSLFIFCIFMCSFTSFFHMFFIVFFFIVNRIAIK